MVAAVKQGSFSAVTATRENFSDLSQSHDVVITVLIHRCYSHPENCFSLSQSHDIVTTALKERLFSAVGGIGEKFLDFSESANSLISMLKERRLRCGAAAQ